MLLGLCLVASLCGACLSQQLIGVEPVGPDQVRMDLDASALTGDQLSSVTTEVLGMFDLRGRFASDPKGAIQALHASACEEPLPAVLFALSECCYRTGKRTHDRTYFLGAAVYAYLYLFGSDSQPPNPYDRRFRWACEFYDQGLGRAFTTEKGERFEPGDGPRALPVGRLNVRVDRSAFPWSAKECSTFLPADRFRVRGLAVRLRDSGLGVALIGVGEKSTEAGASRRQARSRVVPVNAFLRLGGGLTQLEAGLDAGLELRSAYDSEDIVVEGHPVPLEADRSAALAYALDRPDIWDFSLSGLFSSDLAPRTNRLIFVQPYQRGRIPVVLVHGTASSPAYWADLFNSLWQDPELRTRTQFWFFQYSTGNPIPYSAADLRDALRDAVKDFDPEGTDPALKQMVIVGHSQGGLLAKMMVIESHLSWIEEVTGRPVEEMNFTADERALVERCIEFQPLPFVQRVVFVSTPHKGSFHSARWYSRILDDLIHLPQEIGNVSRRVFADSPRLPKELRGRSLTSLDNMDPSSPFLKHLAEAPVAPEVVFHSIISIGDADPKDPVALAEADDGVVEYSSAHIEGVESEVLVPSGHSCQSHPVTIRELRRILREHIAQHPETRP